jgi:hypothetical protein
VHLYTWICPNLGDLYQLLIKGIKFHALLEMKNVLTFAMSIDREIELFAFVILDELIQKNFLPTSICQMQRLAIRNKSY